MDKFIILLWVLSLLLNIGSLFSNNFVYQLYPIGYACVAGFCAGEKIAHLLVRY